MTKLPVVLDDDDDDDDEVRDGERIRVGIMDGDSLQRSVAKAVAALDADRLYANSKPGFRFADAHTRADAEAARNEYIARITNGWRRNRGVISSRDRDTRQAEGKPDAKPEKLGDAAQEWERMVERKRNAWRQGR